jgi:hypothetical protein
MPIQFITPSIISSVANTQVTGTITASQIATVNANTITSGTIPLAQIPQLTGVKMPVGSVLQVVTGTYNVQISTTGITLTDTGLNATITPTSASSKILVMVDQSSVGKTGADERVKIALLRGASQIVLLTELAAYTASAQPNDIGSVTISILDSPATTSATTYKTQFSTINGSGTALVQWNPSTSSITLMEIAA